MPGGRLGRRRFLEMAAAAAAGGCSLIHGVSAAGSGRRRDEPDHAVVLRAPVVAGDGNKVPLVVEMAHPMEPQHYIRSVEVTSARDPVPSKGIFQLTPANGQVYLAFQARLDEGIAELDVTTECSVHGRSSSRPPSITVPDGSGGCAGPLAGDLPRSLDVRPPRIRIPALLKGRGIRPGEVFAVQVGLAHPNRTGLARRDGRFVAAAEPFHLERIEIFYGEEPVSQFLATPAWSDDPLLTFRLRVRRDDVLRVVATNSRRQRLAAEQTIRLMPSGAPSP
jgi:sulfur-oxidizing protein SoxY